jgi:hypothetical protein
MPCIITHTTQKISAEQREHLKSIFGQAISDLPGKSEFWLMCMFDDNKPMYFGGTNDQPVAFIEVNAYATEQIPRANWEKLSATIQDAINKELGVPKNRMYVREIASPDWGWNGGNF